MISLRNLERDLHGAASPSRAKASLWFFKTGKGEYGEGDKFLGVITHQKRVLAKKYRRLPLADVIKLLQSPYHDFRQTALFILNEQYARGTVADQEKIAKCYLQNTSQVNNWDLVDCSAPHILGEYLATRSRAVLYRLARSRVLWERRIAIIATFAFIRRDEYNDSIRLAKILLSDPHDLMHKAVGWTLREVGNRDRQTEEQFLKKYAHRMPRTMLRYAIEKFPSRQRAVYLRM